MRSGVRLGVDVGRARIGIARSDPSGLLATPLETVPRDAEGRADVARILELIVEYGAVELVVGFPLGLGGHRTASTDDAEQFGQALADAGSGACVRLVDERLSTTQAQGQLRAAGRKTKNSRAVIDQAAAVVILQHALDAERSQGRAPGRELSLTSSAPNEVHEAGEHRGEER